MVSDVDGIVYIPLETVLKLLDIDYNDLASKGVIAESDGE